MLISYLFALCLTLSDNCKIDKLPIEVKSLFVMAEKEGLTLIGDFPEQTIDFCQSIQEGKHPYCFLKKKRLISRNKKINTIFDRDFNLRFENSQFMLIETSGKGRDGGYEFAFELIDKLNNSKAKIFSSRLNPSKIALLGSRLYIQIKNSDLSVTISELPVSTAKAQNSPH